MLSGKQSKKLVQICKNHFSGGPYNPHRYRDYSVARSYPSNEEIENYLTSLCSLPATPVRNMRHISPVRQSGPLPAYDGPHCLEDMRKIFFNATYPLDGHPCSVDIDELMRRVPGITRETAEYITLLGLSPDEEVDYAYLGKVESNMV
jgi:hypothetical protein